MAATKATKATTMLTGVGIAALGLALGIGPVAGAQGDDTSFGAGIYEGTCDSPGNTARFDIGDLEADDDVVGTPSIAGTPGTGSVYAEDEGLSVPLEELTAQPHIVLVRASEAADAPAVACGEIAGEPERNELAIDLVPVNDSGVSGLAVFGPPEPGDDDGDQSEVEISVQQGSGMMGTPAA